MHKQLAKKVISSLTLLFFLAGGITESSHIYAAALPSASPVETPFDLAQFNLPPGLAYVHDKNARSKGTVLILEDAHAQPDAQIKIEKILRHLDDHYGVRDVLLEGGAGHGDALLFREFPNRKILRETFDDYLGRGELSGSMSAAVFSKNRLHFSGAEDTELYQQQIKAYFAGLDGRFEMRRRLAEENEKLEVRKRQFYTQTLLDLDHALEVYEKNEGGGHAEQMAGVLEQLFHLNPPVRFPLIEIVRHELNREEAGSEELLRHELETLFEQLRAKVKSPDDFKMMTQIKQAFETQELPGIEIARQLIRWQKLKRWRIPISEGLQQRIREQQRLTKLTGPDFIKQWDAYVHETMTLSLENAEALKVYTASRALKFLDRLSQFELSRDDWEKIAAMDSESQEWPGLEFGFDQSLLSAQLDFYRLAEKREQVFLKKITESLQRSDVSKTVVFVAGGFHTEGLRQALQREDYSSAVITPVFSPFTEDGRYESLMRGEVSWRPYFKALNGKVDLKTSFNQATVSQLIKRQKNTNSGNREAFRFAGLKNWRDQLIRQLADEDRLAEAGRYTRWIDEEVHSTEGEKDSVFDPQGIWKIRIENFITALKQLVDSHQLTETNLAKLFAVPAVSAMADKPFVAIPIPLTMLSSRHFETASGAVSQTGLLQGGVLPSADSLVSRSEVRSLERFEGYSDLKPIVQEALRLLTAEYLIPPKDLEIFKTVFIDETLTGAAPVFQTGPISELRISEEFVRAVKNHSAGPRLLARRLARFLVEREAAQAGANAEMTATLALRADLLRFLGENVQEREEDLQFYQEQIFLSPGEAGFYETAQERMLDHEVSLKSVPVSRARAAQVEARQMVLDETTQALMTDELFLREDALKSKFIKRQIEAFKTEGFFNNAAADHPEAFWRYASLDLMRALVLELTALVQNSRYQEVRQKIADKFGKPADQIQQPIDFDLKPWQLFIKDFQDTRLGSAAMPLESLYHFLTEGVEMPESLEPYTDRDQKMGLLLEQLGWNDPHRLFDAERMSESQKTEAVISLIEFLAGDLREPDENRGHRWDFETMRFEETDPVAIADLPEMNLLTSYWIASQGKNMEVSRYGFFGEPSLRFTTGTLTGVHTAFYKRVQFASILLALRRNPTAQVFTSIDRTGGDEAAVQRITGNSESLELFKAEAAKDPAVASQIIFSDDLRRRASSGFLKTNLDEIFAFQNFLKQLLPSVEKLQDEETKPASRYGSMTEAQAVQELGIAGLELKKQHAEFLTERRAYGVIADGSPAFFTEGEHPVLAVMVDRDQHVDHVIFFTTDADGRILYEDHRKILKKQTFDPALDLAGWLAQQESLYGIAPVERIFYENDKPVFRLRLNSDDSTITAADTIENVQMEDTGKRVLSFSVRQHKLVSLGYTFAPDKTAAADWLSNSVEISPVEREVLPPKTRQKEISRKKTEFVRIHSKASEDQTKKREVISGIENTGLVGSKDQPSLAGDFFTMLKPDETYSSKTTVKAWWALFDQTSDPLYDRSVVERRVFYDTDYYENSESRNPYRPVLELSIYEGENIERIQSFGYDVAGVKTFVDEHDADYQEFNRDAGLEVWQKIQVTRRSFLDAEGRKTLVIELDPKNPGRVLAVKRYREIQRLEQDKKIKQWVEIRYPDTVIETINGRNFDASWSAEDWLRVLAPYELMEADVQAKGAFESARHDLLSDYVNKRKLLEQALVYYNQLQRGEITVEEAWIEAFDGFVQDVLRQGLRPWISDVNERPRDLSRILRRTMNLMDAYGEALGTPKESVSLRARLFAEKVFNAILWSSADYLTAAQAILAGAEAQDVPIQSSGDFAQAVSKVLELYEDQVSPIVSAHERFLKRLGIPAANYEGDFTALRDASPAMQAAYWAAQYLPAEYGVERPDETFSHAVENEGASLLFKTEQTLQPLSPIAELTDVQADSWINKTAAWDNARTPGGDLWNTKRAEVSTEDAAHMTELRGIQDVVYEIYTLNGQQGPRSRESVSQKLYHASKLLKQEGLLVLMLPANKGLSEEGIEQIQDAYGFERVEEGVAFNEFSPEYRNEEILRQQANPDQVAEAEDILQSQKFYVLILRKTSEINVEKKYLPKNQLGIKTFDAPVQDLEGQVMKSRTVSGEVHLGARPRIQDLVKSLTPKQLRPVKPKSRGSRAIKKTAVTHSRVDHRKSDERDFPYITAKLGLLQKYRGLLFQNETGLKEGGKRSRLQSLLNRTFTPSVDRIPRDISKLQTAWNDAQALWWIEDREPQNNQWPKSKMLAAKEGRQGLSVIVSGSAITAVWSHTLDGKGRILYSEPRRLLKTGVVLKDENFNTLQQMEGTLYSAEPDMPAIFTRRRTVYLPVFEAYRDLESLYPAMARYPGLETWFSDDVWRSLESLIYQDPEDDEFNSLFRPFVENRELVLKLKAQWKNAEKIEVEDADRLVQLRRLVRNLRTVTQLWGGPTFGRGQPRTRKSAFGSPQAEAKAHGVTLNANPSFMSALAGAKYVQHLLEQNNGKLVMADLAAGSGALARALDKLDVKAPDAEFQYYELDLSRDYLNQKRPERFEKVRGSYYKPVEGSVTDLPAERGFENDRFDLLTGFFIMDFLGEEESRAMFAQMNRVLKTGGEALLTLPQSWRLTPEYAEALQKLGFEIDVAPMRAAHTATEAWIESIKEHYGNTAIGNQIAEEVRRMKSKQFSVLRIKKTSGFSGDLESVPLELFKLEKTDTGQRGKTTGDKPFDFGPQATHRWLEVLRWVVQDWNPQDLDAYDPAAQTVTRDEIIKNIFPEIETEQALERLYELRAIFSSEQEAGNDYEDIADFYTYWKSGFQQFRREDVERLAQLYRRGPPLQKGKQPGFLSSQDLLRKLESRANYFSGLNTGRDANTYEHFERNQTLEHRIRERISGLQFFLTRFPQTHPLTALAIPEKQRGLYAFYDHFSELQISDPNELVWSPQLISGLEWFFKTVHKPGDNAVAALLENPPELPWPETVPAAPLAPKPAVVPGAETIERPSEPAAPPVPETPKDHEITLQSNQTGKEIRFAVPHKDYVRFGGQDQAFIQNLFFEVVSEALERILADGDIRNKADRENYYTFHSIKEESIKKYLQRRGSARYSYLNSVFKDEDRLDYLFRALVIAPSRYYGLAVKMESALRAAAQIAVLSDAAWGSSGEVRFNPVLKGKKKIYLYDAQISRSTGPEFLRFHLGFSEGSQLLGNSLPAVQAWIDQFEALKKGDEKYKKTRLVIYTLMPLPDEAQILLQKHGIETREIEELINQMPENNELAVRHKDFVQKTVRKIRDQLPLLEAVENSRVKEISAGIEIFSGLQRALEMVRISEEISRIESKKTDELGPRLRQHYQVRISTLYEYVIKPLLAAKVTSSATAWQQAQAVFNREQDRADTSAAALPGADRYFVYTQWQNDQIYFDVNSRQRISPIQFDRPVVFTPGLYHFGGLTQSQKPSSDAAAALNKIPPEGARSEMRAATMDLEADLALVNSNWAVMLENAIKDGKPAENVLGAALRIGLAFQNLHIAGKLEKTEADQEPFESALLELKKAVPEFEGVWETRYGFPTNLPENPTDIANQLESYRLWRISSKEFEEAESFVEEWLTVREDDRPALIRRIKAWTGNETDHYTDLRSYNRRLLIWIKFNEEIQTNFGLDLEALARIRLEFNDRFIFLNEISTLSPQIVLPALQSILEVESSGRGITPGSRVDLLRVGDAIFAHASSELTVKAGRQTGMGVFDMTRLSSKSLLRRYTYAFNVDLDKMGQFETRGDQAMMNGLNSGKWGAFEKLYAQEDRDSRIRRFHKLVQLMNQVQSKQIDVGRFNQLTDIMLGRVNSIVEAGTFFSKAAQWKNPQARKHALTRISKKLMALMADPERKEELYEIFRTSVLTTLATGIILWQAEEFLSESARLDQKPARSFFFDGKEQGLAATLIQEGLSRAEDAALTVGLMTFVTLDLESVPARLSGRLTAAAQWVRQLRYQAFFEREITSGDSQMVSLIFIASEDHLEAAKTLGQWLYRKQKTTADPLEQALLWERARHWLDLLWVRNAGGEPGQSREELHAIFEMEATGLTLPDDPPEAAAFLVQREAEGHKIWIVTPEDHRFVEDNVRNFLESTDSDAREALMNELKKWVEVSDDPWGNQTVSRRYLVLVKAIKQAAFVETPSISPSESIEQFKNAMFPAGTPAQQEPALRALEVHLLERALDDSGFTTSIEQQWIQQLAAHTAFFNDATGHPFKESLQGVTASSPLYVYEPISSPPSLDDAKVREVLDFFDPKSVSIKQAKVQQEAGKELGRLQRSGRLNPKDFVKELGKKTQEGLKAIMLEQEAKLRELGPAERVEFLKRWPALQGNPKFPRDPRNAAARLQWINVSMATTIMLGMMAQSMDSPTEILEVMFAAQETGQPVLAGHAVSSLVRRFNELLKRDTGREEFVRLLSSNQNRAVWIAEALKSVSSFPDVDGHGAITIKSLSPYRDDERALDSSLRHLIKELALTDDIRIRYPAQNLVFAHSNFFRESQGALAGAVPAKEEAKRLSIDIVEDLLKDFSADSSKAFAAVMFIQQEGLAMKAAEILGGMVHQAPEGERDVLRAKARNYLDFFAGIQAYNPSDTKALLTAFNAKAEGVAAPAVVKEATWQEKMLAAMQEPLWNLPDKDLETMKELVQKMFEPKLAKTERASAKTDLKSFIRDSSAGRLRAMSRAIVVNELIAEHIRQNEEALYDAEVLHQGFETTVTVNDIAEFLEFILLRTQAAKDTRFSFPIRKDITSKLLNHLETARSLNNLKDPEIQTFLQQQSMESDLAFFRVMEPPSEEMRLGWQAVPEYPNVTELLRSIFDQEALPILEMQATNVLNQLDKLLADADQRTEFKKQIGMRLFAKFPLMAMFNTLKLPGFLGEKQEARFSHLSETLDEMLASTDPFEALNALPILTTYAEVMGVQDEVKAQKGNLAFLLGRAVQMTQSRRPFHEIGNMVISLALSLRPAESSEIVVVGDFLEALLKMLGSLKDQNPAIVFPNPDEMALEMKVFAVTRKVSKTELRRVLQVPDGKSLTDNRFKRVLSELPGQEAGESILPEHLSPQSLSKDPFQAMLQTARANEKRKLWVLTAEDKTEIQRLADEIYAAADENARIAALKRLDAFLTSSNRYQEWSRRYYAFIVLRRKAVLEAHEFESVASVRRNLSAYVLRVYKNQPVFGSTPAEQIEELQLLIEGVTDESLGPQERLYMAMRMNLAWNLLARTFTQKQEFPKFLEEMKQSQSPLKFIETAIEAVHAPLGIEQGATIRYDDMEGRRYLLFKMSEAEQNPQSPIHNKVEGILDALIPHMTDFQEFTDFFYYIPYSQSFLRKVPEVLDRFNERLADPAVQAALTSKMDRLLPSFSLEGIGNNLQVKPLFDADSRFPRFRDAVSEGLESDRPFVSAQMLRLVSGYIRTLYQNIDIMNKGGEQDQSGVVLEAVHRQELFVLDFFEKLFHEKGFSIEEYDGLFLIAMPALFANDRTGIWERIAERAEKVMREELEQAAPADRTAVLAKFDPRKIENLFTGLTGWDEKLNGDDLRRILEVAPGQPFFANRFQRAVGLRSEVRTMAANDLQKLSEQTVGYLVSGRMPSSIFLTRLGQFAENYFPALELRLRDIADRPAEMSVLSLQTPEWTDPEFEAGFSAESKRLEQQGLAVRVNSGADIVRIYTSTPQTDALIAAMKNQPNLNVYGVWQPESFTDKPNMTAMRKQAEKMEYEVNRALGALDVSARFKLAVPESRWKLERLIKESPSVLMTLKGRQDFAVVTGRVVVVYDPESLLEVGTLSELKSLRHQIPASDKRRFAKEYLLYASASEISQEVLSQLYRAFIEGEGHFTFKDDRISADLLASFIGMEHLIAQQFASSA